MERLVNPYVSVDCVLLGFDGTQLNVLIVRQKESGNDDNSTNNYKLPGSLIYMDENLDEAAKRVLKQLTGLVQIRMEQFHAFGDVKRLANPNDTVWLERFHHLEHHLGVFCFEISDDLFLAFALWWKRQFFHEP